MSTWTTPITWITGDVSAATANTEWRDHLNWLKGAIDLITDGTASDVGTTTRLAIIRTNGTDDILQGHITGDTQERIAIDASGKMNWGSGTAVADVNLYRSGAGNLKTDNRISADQIQLNTTGQGIEMPNGAYLDFYERAAAPGAPSANMARLFARDNGSGKTQLCVIGSSGGVAVLWTQP